MDSNSSGTGYLLNHSALSSVYYQGNEEDGSIIDLGLSLRALQPETYDHPPSHDGYGELIDWHHLHPQMKISRNRFQRNVSENSTDEMEAVQSKEMWAYVKVNMDGVIVGRKICIVDHMEYSSLALQLEDMFGLHLFQPDSEFSLFYKDRDEQWRVVGDVPWKEFVDSVKRLRIVRNNEAFATPSTFA